MREPRGRARHASEPVLIQLFNIMMFVRLANRLAEAIHHHRRGVPPTAAAS